MKVVPLTTAVSVVQGVLDSASWGVHISSLEREAIRILESDSFEVEILKARSEKDVPGSENE